MYNVQCLAGHVFGAEPGSELEKKCIEHEKKGYLDAPSVSREECAECTDDRERVSQAYAISMFIGNEHQF